MSTPDFDGIDRIRSDAGSGVPLTGASSQLLEAYLGEVLQENARLRRERSEWRDVAHAVTPDFEAARTMPAVARRWVLSMRSGMQARLRRLLATHDALLELASSASMSQAMTAAWRKRFRAYLGGWTDKSEQRYCPTCNSSSRIHFGFTTDARDRTTFCGDRWHFTEA